MNRHKNLIGKKLLILGGSYQHLKIVKAAKRLGVKTYVTDYLPIEESPAKQIADVALMYNITDIESLCKFCASEKIDGVVAPYLDVTQIPTLQICEKMGYPCFGNKKQYKNLTDKIAFKNFCKEKNVDTIESYTENDIVNNPEKIGFPILIKPNDSRGSRGQTICYKVKEIPSAIEYAKKHSHSGEAIIEKYLGSSNDVEIASIVIDGVPIFIRMLDRFLGSKENGFDKLAIAEIFPSKFYNKNLEKLIDNIITLIDKFGLKYSPVFLQAFIDNCTIKPYDPGIRLPGDDFDIIYKTISGIDIPEMLVKYALTGSISKKYVNNIKNAKTKQVSAMIWPCLRAGKISAIEGFEELKQNKKFVSFSKAYSVGKIVADTHDVRQRFGEFCIVCKNIDDLKSTIDEFFNNLKVIDENGENMLIEKFDTTILDKYI